MFKFLFKIVLIVVVFCAAATAIYISQWEYSDPIPNGPIESNDDRFTPTYDEEPTPDTVGW